MYPENPVASSVDSYIKTVGHAANHVVYNDLVRAVFNEMLQGFTTITIYVFLNWHKSLSTIRYVAKFLVKFSLFRTSRNTSRSGIDSRLRS